VPPDPYSVLGVPPTASDEELRRAYRRLVKLHHPDHNAGSAASERRFEEVQEAYARVLEMRRRPAGGAGGAGGGSRAQSPRAGPGAGPGVDVRIEELERELRAARHAREAALRDAREAALHDAREAALRDAREAALGVEGRRPTDEELGYVETDDSFSKILADALEDIAERLKRRG
jgi:curved DNA-binding protein CbpA